MCELFAVNARQPQTLNSPLTTFFGDSEMHPHGWGLSIRNAEGKVRLTKGPERALDSELLANVLDHPVSTTTALAHIRYATRGKLSYDNCHPFLGVDVTGTTWSFIHNGSIFHPELIDGFGAAARGESDSECVLLYLMDALDSAGARSFDERFGTLAEALGTLSPNNKLNVILENGEQLFAFTNTEDDTLYWKHEKGVTTFCTRPLDEGSWAPVPKLQLVALSQGELVRASVTRGGLYRYDEAELSAFLVRNAA